MVRVTDEHSGEINLVFAEVSYRNGKPVGWNQCYMIGDSVDDLRELADRLREACNHPVIDARAIEAMGIVAV